MKRKNLLQSFRNLLRKRGILKWPEETRCHICREKSSCPAYDTGVIYPCPYYSKEEE